MKLIVKAGKLYAPEPPATPAEWDHFFDTAALVAPGDLKYWILSSTSFCQATAIVTHETPEPDKLALYQSWYAAMERYKNRLGDKHG